MLTSDVVLYIRKMVHAQQISQQMLLSYKMRVQAFGETMEHEVFS